MWLARAAELHDRDYVSSPFRKLRLTQATSLALSAYYFMYDYPDTAHFLTPEERREVQHRLEADQSFLDDQFRMKYFWDAVRDWKIYVIMLITIGIFTPLYSFSLFLPTIIEGLGYTKNSAQLMSVPPYVVACFVCITGGWMADRHAQRGIYLVCFNILA